jgi:hypothetical protein
MHVILLFLIFNCYYYYHYHYHLIDERFPIAWIDDWSNFFFDDHLEDKLERWIKELGPYYETGSELRNKVLKMLTTEYWYSQIEKKYVEYHEMMDRNNNSNTNNTSHYLRRRKR